MVRYALDDHFENARYLHHKMLPVINALFEDGNPGGVKMLMSHMGLCQKYVRAPLFDVKPDLALRLKKMASLQ